MKKWLRKMNIFKIPNRKFFFLPLLFLVLLSVFFVAKPVLAEEFGSLVTDTAARLVMLLVGGLGKILLIVINLLTGVAQYNSFITAPAVSKGWIIVRDISNMFFIAALLVIAFSTVLGKEKYSYKSTLGALLQAAVLINFSKFICGFFIDISQILMLTFVSAFKDAAAGNFLQMLGMDKWLSVSGAHAGGASAFVGSLFALILTIVSLIVISIMTIILVFRIVMIWLLVVLSPLVFVLNIFPGKGKSYSNMWWDKFANQLIVGPVMAFFIWLSFAVSGQGSVIPQDSTGPIEGATVGQTVNLQQDNSVSEAANPANFAKFAVSIAMLVGSLMIAQQLGVAGGKMAGQAVGKMQAYATGKAGVLKRVKDKGKVVGATGKAFVGATGATLGKGLLEGGKKVGLRVPIEFGEDVAKMPGKLKKDMVDRLNKGKQKRAKAVSEDGTKDEDGNIIRAGFMDKVLNAFDRNFDKFGAKDITLGQLAQTQRVKDDKDRLSTKSKEELRALAKIGSATEKMAAAILLSERGFLKGNTADNRNIIKTAQTAMAGNPILRNQFNGHIKKTSDADLAVETQYNNFKDKKNTEEFLDDVNEGKVDLSKMILEMNTGQIDNLIKNIGNDGDNSAAGKQILGMLSLKQAVDIGADLSKTEGGRITRDKLFNNKVIDEESSDDMRLKYFQTTGRLDNIYKGNPAQLEAFVKSNASSVTSNINPESLRDKAVLEAILKQLTSKQMETVASGDNREIILDTLKGSMKEYNAKGNGNTAEAKRAREAYINLTKGKDMGAIYEGIEGTDDQSEANRMNIDYDFSQGIENNKIKPKDLESLDINTLKNRPEIGQAILKLDFGKAKEYIKNLNRGVREVLAQMLDEMEQNAEGKYTTEQSEHATDLLNRFGKIGNSVCSKDRNKRVEEEKRKADAEQKAKEVAAREKKKAQDFKKTIIS